MNINENESPALDCLDGRGAGVGCAGPVEMRPAMSPSGRWFPRCEGHLAARLKTQERLSRDYGVPLYY